MDKSIDSKVAEFMNLAFRTRAPRSAEYKDGYRAGLAKALEPSRTLQHPHEPGTCQSDAWFAGLHEAQENQDRFTSCANCGRIFLQPIIGRPAKFCGDTCRVANHRQSSSEASHSASA